MFEVTLVDGRKTHRHADQLRSRAPAVAVPQSVGRESEPDDDFEMSIPNTEAAPETSTSDTEPEQIETAPAETETPRTNDEPSESNSLASRARVLLTHRVREIRPRRVRVRARIRASQPFDVQTGLGTLQHTMVILSCYLVEFWRQCVYLLSCGLKGEELLYFG